MASPGSTGSSGPLDMSLVTDYPLDTLQPEPKPFQQTFWNGQQNQPGLHTPAEEDDAAGPPSGISLVFKVPVGEAYSRTSSPGSTTGSKRKRRE